MNYKKTLNLPRTDFPMKANLPERELEFLARWEKMDLYNLLREKSKGRKKYVLHDGPPYANGYIHLGTVLNKILKDITVKSRQMAGLDAIYIPGWDCHGLPIEHEVDRQLGSKKFKLNIVTKRQKCRAYAKKFVDIQRKEFIRLGILGDWLNPYLTMQNTYEATVASEFACLYHNKLIYKAKKPIYWCISCETALAEAEVEYANYESLSIYVAFPLIDNLFVKCPSKYYALNGLKVYMVIWTTTPWTIPANLAIAAHPNFEYGAYKFKNKVYILATHLALNCQKFFGFLEWEQVTLINSCDLEGLKIKHPLYDRVSIGVLADYITLETGTGLVHIAPGHGREDFETALRYGLEIYSPVNDQGVFTEEVEFFAGQKIFQANYNVVVRLQNAGVLLGTEKINHSYPHCWRCKKPVIFRATKQWFISMEQNNLRIKALSAIINQVHWVPKWGSKRIYSMIEKRPDWCISRQRSWGVPIIVFKCLTCDKTVLTQQMAKIIVESFMREGADVWFTKTSFDLLGDLCFCSLCGGSDLKKEMDILDVWFDSGVSHAVVLDNIKHWPADMYLEGSDQHRGWFHSSLLCAIGTRGRAPYKMVLTHGFVVDGEGRKMSKSLGNVISPQTIIDRYGAEILRLWVAAENYTNDIRMSENILKQLVEGYRRIRNTMRFILGNLYDFDPTRDIIAFEKMSELDRLMLHRLESLKTRLKNSYKKFAFHTIYYSLHNFCAIDLSSFYLDIRKDRLYASLAINPARRVVQTILYYLVFDMVRFMAPIFSFTAEEIWDYLPKAKDMYESVHLAGFPEANPIVNDFILAERWERLILIRAEMNKALDLARKKRIIGNSLHARLIVAAPEEIKNFLVVNSDVLIEITMVSELIFVDELNNVMVDSAVVTGLKINVSFVEYFRCGRCWMHLPTVGMDAKYPELCQRCVKVIKSNCYSEKK